MAMICIFGTQECDGSCLDRCQPEGERTPLYCDCCGEEIEAVYYEINNDKFCPTCLDELFGRSLLDE